MSAFIGYLFTGPPFAMAFGLCVTLAALAWLLSVVTREYSWADRLWPLCPPVYCLLVAVELDFASSRVNLMTALVVLWGVRLAFNLARRGGYRPGNEDYRWAIVREKAGPLGFQVVNFTVTAFGQMLLVWLFTSPVHQAWLWSETPLGLLDLLAAALFVVLLVGETIADQQMWVFQQDKKRRIAAGEAVGQPFIVSGLYRYCRHPNYFCEMGMWWVFYLFAVSASGQWLHWTGLGFVGLTALFIASTRFGESISASRHPGYRAYQARTPALVPGLGFRTWRRTAP